MSARVEIRPLEIHGSNNSFDPDQRNNIYLLVRGTKAVLIDGCYAHDQARECVAQALEGLTLTDILVTHFHPDHSEYAARIREKYGAALWANPEETRIGKFVKDDEIDGRISGDQEIETGAGITVRAVATPGHTHSHTCYFLEESGTLFTGDHIIGKGTPWVGPPHGNIRDYLASLLKVRGMPLEEIRGGHGPLIENPRAKIDEYYGHRMIREAQILQQLESGPKTIEQMVQVIYADVDSRVHTLAGMVVRGHLDKLLYERRVGEYKDGGQLLFEMM